MVELAAYRSVLRLCRNLDRCPEGLTMLLGRPARRYHPGLRKLVQIPPGRYPFVDDAISEASGGSSEYSLPAENAGAAAAAARRHRRRLIDVGFSYEPEAQELISRLTASRDFAQEVKVHIESAESTRATAKSTSQLKLPSFHWLHPRSDTPVQIGDIMIAHPLACLFQPELDQGVVVISEVDEEAGSAHGLIINKRDGSSLADALVTSPDPPSYIKPLLDADLYVGGDLVAPMPHLLDRINWLHVLPDIVGSVELLPGLYLGGDLEQAAHLISCKKASIASLRPVLGFVGWECTQLELELERGVWIRARAAPGDSFWNQAFLRARKNDSCNSLDASPDSSCEFIAAFDQDFWRAALVAAGFPALTAVRRRSDECFSRESNQINDAELKVNSHLIRWVEAHEAKQVEELLERHRVNEQSSSNPSFL